MDILIGLQWGDEGKGKFIDLMAKKYDIIARFNGGANAGHTIYHNNQKITLKLLPSGVFYPNVKNVIGTGVVVDPVSFINEANQFHALKGVPSLYETLLISKKAHLVLPTAKYYDSYWEKEKGLDAIGTTKNGIGFTYANKALRINPRVEDVYCPIKTKNMIALIDEQFKELTKKGIELPDFHSLLDTFLTSIETMRSFRICDTEQYINEAIRSKQKILAEGAQATMLDLDHGSYPFVTSSTTISAGACTGLGVSPKHIDDIYGVVKSYSTRVGNGPFPTEIFHDEADNLRTSGNEFGSNTKRPRRVGWLDIPLLQYAAMVNGVTKLLITKLDVLDKEKSIPICLEYKQSGNTSVYDSLEIPVYQNFKGWQKNISVSKNRNDLPIELVLYISFIENQLSIPITAISIGPKREDIILFDEEEL